MFPPGLPCPETMKEDQRIDLSLRFDRLVQSVADLETLADAFSLPELKDGERIHLSSIPTAAEIRRRTGNTVIPTITLRDSNRQSLMGQISFCLFSGIENIQVVRGDAYDSGSPRHPRNVYDYSKVSDFVASIRRLESHLTNAPKICVLAPINLSKLSNNHYVRTIKDRERSGVDIFVTESNFEDTESYITRVQKARDLGVNATMIHSVFPLRDYDDAISCVRKFGWKVPEDELHGLKAKGTQFGIETARQRYFGLVDRKEITQGASISTRGNPELVRQIIS